MKNFRFPLLTLLVFLTASISFGQGVTRWSSYENYKAKKAVSDIAIYGIQRRANDLAKGLSTATPLPLSLPAGVQVASAAAFVPMLNQDAGPEEFAKYNKNAPQVPDPKISKPVFSDKITREIVISEAYQKDIRNISVLKQKELTAVFKAYGIKKYEQREYYPAFYMPIELGGLNVPENRWLESWFTQPYNATIRNAFIQMVLTNIREDRISLDDARKLFIEDWRKSYENYKDKLKPEKAPVKQYNP